jgi:putative Mg2+ transporter-C (MgtC) family protein
MEEQIPSWLEAMRTFSWPQMIQVLVAALLGGLIGLEREWRGHEAGFRTNMLIAMGACLFTIVSIRGFPLVGSTARDSSRVAAGVVTGIGFLGAGAIIQSQQKIKGITTAATVWMVAAIGMTVGVEAYALAVFSSVITFIILRFLRPVSKTVAHLGDD